MKHLLIILMSFQSAMVVGQTTDSTKSPWTRRLEIGLNLNQASFTPNWKGGGTNNFAMGSLVNGSLLYTNGKFTWSNDLQLQYGFQKNEGQTRRKTQDLVFIDTKAGYDISENLNAFGAVNFVSQFAEGLNYSKDPLGNEVARVMSRWMAPAYFTQSLGVQYKPVPYFMARLGALAIRQTFVTDPMLSAAGAFGVDSGSTVKVDYGYQIVASFDKNLAKNLNLKARYLSFGDYTNFQRTNHRLDLIFAARITRYINTNFTAVMLYDRNQDLAVQWSQVLALGVLFQLR
ncbi:MAG: hypothetical protein C0424_07990 [Sphingobacteriaceae bacterium]|nr:hypothetical protein [Sphingobacteriaceae bacterium]